MKTGTVTVVSSAVGSGLRSTIIDTVSPSLNRGQKVLHVVCGCPIDMVKQMYRESLDYDSATLVLAEMDSPYDSFDGIYEELSKRITSSDLATAGFQCDTIVLDVAYLIQDSPTSTYTMRSYNDLMTQLFKIASLGVNVVAGMQIPREYA